MSCNLQKLGFGAGNGWGHEFSGLLHSFTIFKINYLIRFSRLCAINRFEQNKIIKPMRFQQACLIHFENVESDSEDDDEDPSSDTRIQLHNADALL